MPTYEYICEACEHEFEQFQSIKADPVKVCPVCAAEKVRRKISSGAAIIFKGGGFYETDYRSEKYKEAAKKEADSSKPADSKSDKSDANGKVNAEKTSAANPSQISSTDRGGASASGNGDGKRESSGSSEATTGDAGKKAERTRNDDSQHRSNNNSSRDAGGKNRNADGPTAQSAGGSQADKPVTGKGSQQGD